MPLQLRGEQRYRDGPRLDCGEEPCDVVETLGREYRDPVSARRDLLHLRTDGSHPGAELGPGQFHGASARCAGVVQIAVGHGIADVRDSALDERNQRDPGRHGDVACGVQAVLDLQETLAHSDVGPRIDSSYRID